MMRSGKACWPDGVPDEHAGLWHECLFGNPKRVARLRVQAKGRIAARYLRWVFVLRWALPIVVWLDGQLQDVSDSRGQDCDDDNK